MDRTRALKIIHFCPKAGQNIQHHILHPLAMTVLYGFLIHGIPYHRLGQAGMKCHLP